MNAQKSHDSKHSALDKGLHELGQAYRDLGSEDPPDLLDQAILSRAHREVEGKPGWMQFGWLHGLTTAVVVVLAFSIVLQQREPISVEESILLEGNPPQIPGEPIRTDTLQQVAPTAAMKLEAKEVADSNLETLEYDEPRQQVLLQEKGAGAPPPARELEASLEEEPLRRSRAKGTAINETDFYAVTAPPESKDEDALQDVIPEEQQLAEILRLKNAGDESWKKELEYFRQQYPDYLLPAELQD